MILHCHKPSQIGIIAKSTRFMLTVTVAKLQYLIFDWTAPTDSVNKATCGSVTNVKINLSLYLYSWLFYCLGAFKKTN